MFNIVNKIKTKSFAYSRWFFALEYVNLDDLPLRRYRIIVENGRYQNLFLRQGSVTPGGVVLLGLEFKVGNVQHRLARLHQRSSARASVYGKGWEEAMQSEFDGHTKTGTFHMVDRVPEGRKPVSSKRCFDFKTDKKEKITKLKTRLVARRFTQIRDVDYTYSISPVFLQLLSSWF